MNGDIIIDKEKILERWAEYIRELFKDDRKDHNIMKNNFAGPLIMKEEVETAIKKMKHGKATGPDNISVELIEALEDFGIGKVTHLLNEIYDTGPIPTDLSKSIFIALPKKPRATECELHRTISLMSHITKKLLKIIMLRIRNKIKPEIAEEHDMPTFYDGYITSNQLHVFLTLVCVSSSNNFSADSQPELSTLVEDKEVAARAVAFVVNSTRKGIVPLCADIANLLRAKRSLEKKVYLLKREIEALRSSTSASFRTSHSTSATPPLLEKILVSEQAGGLSSRPCSRSSQCSSTMSNSPRLESTHNFKSYLSSPSVSGDGLRRTSPRLPRQHPKFVVNGSCNVSAAPSNTFSDEASHKNETTTLAKRADGSRKNSLPEMTSEPSLEVKRVSPKANKETQCCITLAGDSPREEQFIETVRLNSKLAEELGSAKKEIEVLKGRLKELEMIQLARECTKQHYQECQGLPGEAIYPGTRDDCSLTAPESSNKAATYRPQASKNHRLSPLSKPRSIKTTARSSYVCAEPLYGCKCSACEAAMGGDLHAALNDSLKVDLHKFPIR
ncbi:hypothetical protein PoB_005894800 [Plakobranchus ocellatus]|uniref:Uncharacterized protein n=1 Tax=Plakobranchus ocellatus TaxID=259542 RepID=A0AAV4CME6_9GAST|nr:hypothetical protein PoB_005894800 [Plakobranchus ocellatus]